MVIIKLDQINFQFRQKYRKRKEYSNEDKVALFDLDTRYYQLTDAIRNSDNELSKEEFKKMRDKVTEQKNLITKKYD